MLRYAAEYKDLKEPLRDFIRRQGGINKCAARFARRLGGRDNTVVVFRLPRLRSLSYRAR